MTSGPRAAFVAILAALILVLLASPLAATAAPGTQSSAEYDPAWVQYDAMSGPVGGSTDAGAIRGASDVPSGLSASLGGPVLSVAARSGVAELAVRPRPHLRLPSDLVAPTSAVDDLARLCKSFSADTEVLMADGTTTAISDIQVGDEVWALDPETGEAGIRMVSAVWPHEDWLLDFSVDGGTVTTTENHHFWNQSDGEWQETQDIDAGALLLTAEGTLVAAGSLDWASVHRGAAYDLTVEDFHSYFVVAGDAEVLVHNQNGPCIPGRPFTGANAPDAAFEHLDRFHGLDTNVASNRLHQLKESGGLGAADDVAIGRTGDVYDARTGEYLGSLTDPGLGTGR